MLLVFRFLRSWIAHVFHTGHLNSGVQREPHIYANSWEGEIKAHFIQITFFFARARMLTHSSYPEELPAADVFVEFKEYSHFECTYL